MNLDFNEYLDVLEDDGFEEYPVDAKTFVEGEEYFAQPPLSDEQYMLLEAMTQIYRKQTLIDLYGEEAGTLMWKKTVFEIIAMLGKGSGKNEVSTDAVGYIIYKLLCLKDPSKYYGKPPGDAIDIINIAINSDQAKRTFFQKLVNKIKKSPWFQGKYDDKQNYIEFDKNVNCYSGHSERESFEGYNPIVVILDEIAGFAVDNTSGHEQAKTADAIYTMYHASVESRFDDVGKLVLLSFPRFKGDFIQTRYEKVVAQKETEEFSHTFKIDDDLPDGLDENEYTVEWEEDQIISYSEPKVFAMKKPSWRVNPTKTIESYRMGFFNNPIDTLSRFACMPPDAIDAFFRDKQKVEAAFARIRSPFNEDWSFREEFKSDPEKLYFIHADLAYKHDRAAVAMAHVDKWIKRNDNKVSGTLFDDLAAHVIIDSVRWWTPKPNHPIDLNEVKDHIIDLKKRGFNIKLVTMDQWHSFEVDEALVAAGLVREKLSVAKPHYEDFQFAIQESRVDGYYIEILLQELLKLRIIKGNKVDHPRAGGKDLADAVTGAVYDAITLTPKELGPIEIEAYVDEVPKPVVKNEIDGLIKAPDAGERKRLPDDLEAFFKKLEVV